MKPDNHLPAKIKQMSIGGPSLMLKNARERQNALNHARTLRQAGVIEFLLVTKPSKGGGFTATAVPE